MVRIPRICEVYRMDPGLTSCTGPAGRLLELLDRHPFRPAHIHILVSFYQHHDLQD